MTNKSLILIPLILLFLGACATSSVPMRILVPADISIDKSITHVGVINRTIPHKKRKIANILEGFITGEQIFADREGADNCIDGLIEQLSQSPRFTAVQIRRTGLRGTGTRRFPRQLDWDRVRRICDKFRVDALIVLETFDSDIHFDIDKELVTKKIKLKGSDKKKKVKVPEYTAELYIDVNSGWRIYDPVNSRIIDMNVYTDRKAWESVGKTRADTLEDLPTKREAINLSGYHSGIQYAIRISPTWIHIHRDFYVKGDPKLEEAKRLVRSDDWDAAIKIWKSMLDHPDNKIAGRACYNLAFANELKGRFEAAYHWAKRAWTEFGNKKARNYMGKIQTRIIDKKRLKDQLDTED